ncbi:MAG TPA: C39 family peptidase [Luteimonas sp.]|nr:C39 family peptidase [Luteimonas sp.]
MKAGVLAASLLLCASASGQAGTAEVRADGGTYAVRLTSLKEARFRTTIRQRYDFSCGSAAVATLLTYQYGQPVAETEVFMRMYASGDQAKIRQEGFSLLDMRRYFESLGYQADGFELPLEKLAEERLPAIVLLNERGYRHFVVVKGLRDGRVLIGDPAMGTRAMPRERFEKLWDNRVLFVVHNRRELASFNAQRDWRAAPAAPLELAIQRGGLQNIVMPRRGPGDI